MNLNSENVKSVLTIDKPNYCNTIIISRVGEDMKAENFMTKHKVSVGYCRLYLRIICQQTLLTSTCFELHMSFSKIFHTPYGKSATDCGG